MARRKTVSPEELAEAEAKAAEDAALLEQLNEQKEQEEPENPSSPTIADRFVGMNELLRSERLRTRLSEATLTKNMELALNYHVWETQRAEARAQQGFDPRSFMDAVPSGDEPLDGPTPDEYIGEAIDNVTEVDFTPTSEE